jgi:hypothetical protein
MPGSSVFASEEETGVPEISVVGRGGGDSATGERLDFIVVSLESIERAGGSTLSDTG